MTYKLGTDNFKYYNHANITTEEEFDEFVKGVKELTPYEIKDTAVFGDQLITLSTCNYHTKNGRMFIVAKKIR